MDVSRPARIWNELNVRQRAYLAACYRQDQEAEAGARARHAAGQDPGPSSQWRKLPFTVRADPAFTGYTQIQEQLRAEGYHDAGAGATLHALTNRGLVQVTEDQVEVFPLGFVPRVLVELTRLGRSCARAGLGERQPARLPAHLLSEWLWRNLVKVAQAGPAGLAEADLVGRSKFYLGTGFRPQGTPSRGFIDQTAVREEAGAESYVKEFRWHLTETGRRHLMDYRETYAALYPDVITEDMSLD
jgi:hypothetical protein